jgi:hypothetical protein
LRSFHSTAYDEAIPYVLLTGLHLLPISETNKLPTACNRREAAQKKVVKVTLLNHGGGGKVGSTEVQRWWWGW